MHAFRAFLLTLIRMSLALLLLFLLPRFLLWQGQLVTLSVDLTNSLFPQCNLFRRKWPNSQKGFISLRTKLTAYRGENLISLRLVDLSSEGPLFSFPAFPATTGGGGNVADANDAAGPVRRVEAPGELRQVEQVCRHQSRPK